MIRISLPAIVICIIMYLVLGNIISTPATGETQIAQKILRDLEQIYNFNILLLLPAVIVFGGAILRFPPILPIAFWKFDSLSFGNNISRL